jgi:hypothetical protein
LTVLPFDSTKSFPNFGVEFEGDVSPFYLLKNTVKIEGDHRDNGEEIFSHL